MIDADMFLDAAGAVGIDVFAGVPCSYLTPLINRTASGGAFDYVGAASEGEAVAIAAGAWLAGHGTAVLCQNSGLGNAVNPLTSLNAPFRIPTLLVTTWRGEPGGKPDEPQHALMGRITPALLDVLAIAHAPFPSADQDVAPAIGAAQRVLDDGRVFAFVMSEGSVQPIDLAQRRPEPAPRGTAENRRTGSTRPVRATILERVLAAVPDDVAIVATTGKCGRELFTLADRPQHFYQVGSMGCAAGMGLGIARVSGRRTVVLDGDGAALMKLGTEATIGAYAPRTLLHVVLDNESHDSTGGQATVSPSVDFTAVAIACGYRRAIAVDDADGFERAFRTLIEADGPSMLHVRIAPGSLPALGRPTVPPHEVARRFRAFVTSG